MARASTDLERSFGHQAGGRATEPLNLGELEPGAAVVTGSNGNGTAPTPAKAVLTKQGLRLPPDLTYEAWAALAHEFRGRTTSLAFGIGDWLNYGERRFGEMYSQAIDATGYEYGYLRQVASTARAIPMEERDSRLPFSFYNSIRDMEAEDRALLTSKGLEGGLTRAGFRALVSEYKKQRALPEAPSGAPIVMPASQLPPENVSPASQMTAQQAGAAVADALVARRAQEAPAATESGDGLPLEAEGERVPYAELVACLGRAQEGEDRYHKLYSEIEIQVERLQDRVYDLEQRALPAELWKRLEAIAHNPSVDAEGVIAFLEGRARFYEDKLGTR